MAHPENEEEQEPKYWTPEEEAARFEDPDAKLRRVLDKAERGLDDLKKESLAAPPAGLELTPLGARAQIEIRIIANGFIMTYSRARLEPRAWIPFDVYRPVEEEVFISGPSTGAAYLKEAMEHASLLAESLRKLDEWLLKQSVVPPPSAPTSP